MSQIKVEYSLKTKGQDKSLHVKALDMEWKKFDAAYIVNEIFESIISSSFDSIHFDFSELQFVTSSCMGSFTNLCEKATTSNKNITFDFGQKVKSTLELAGINL